MSDQEPFDVFEHGVVISDGDPPSGLARVATTRQPIYSGYTITVVDRDGSSLNHRANHLVDVPGPYQTRDLWDENNGWGNRFLSCSSLGEATSNRRFGVID